MIHMNYEVPSFFTLYNFTFRSNKTQILNSKGTIYRKLLIFSFNLYSIKCLDPFQFFSQEAYAIMITLARKIKYYSRIIDMFIWKVFIIIELYIYHTACFVLFVTAFIFPPCSSIPSVAWACHLILGDSYLMVEGSPLSPSGQLLWGLSCCWGQWLKE